MVRVCGVTGTYTPDTCSLSRRIRGTAMSRDLCLCFGWKRPFHDEVTETWAGVHAKLLWS
jgi:hypothetical protein